MKRARWGAALLVVVAALLVAVPDGARAASIKCGSGDAPETGVQGEVPPADQLSGRSQQGYRCNIRPVATNNLGGIGGDVQMTWYKNCAYQAAPQATTASDGVGVVDVSDPNHPKLTQIIRLPAWAGRGGRFGIHEGLHASDSRGILVVPIDTMISVFDISRDCSHPTLLATYDFGQAPDAFHDPGEPMNGAGVHAGELSPDGTLYYSTDVGGGFPSPPWGPCLRVIDLRDPRHPKLVTGWGNFTCHDLALSPDGRRAYVGYFGHAVGFTSAGVVGLLTPAGAVGHALTGVRVVDVSAFQDHRAKPTAPILGELTGGRQHTIVYAKIHGRPYVLGAEEAYCPGGNGRIVDISNERKPVQVSEIPLGVNQPANCANASYNQNADLFNHYTSHYLSVDNPEDAHLAFYTWYGAGLRVFEISDPKHPHEVAYFNPAVGAGASRTHDISLSYPRYIPSTGQIWFGSAVNGLNIVELAPELRPRVKGTVTSTTWSVGPAPRRVEAPIAARAYAPTGPTMWFCTLRL